jgi:hypothetical protein
MAKLRVVQIPRREVERHFKWKAVLGQRPRVAQGLSDHPACERIGQVGPLGEGHERVGRYQPSRRMCPAHQRLDPHRTPGSEVDLALIVQDQLPGRDCRLQFAQQSQPCGVVVVDAAVIAEIRSSVAEMNTVGIKQVGSARDSAQFRQRGGGSECPTGITPSSTEGRRP